MQTKRPGLLGVAGRFVRAALPQALLAAGSPERPRKPLATER
jgi:hypothetical protein